jgi:hypothetical protein
MDIKNHHSMTAPPITSIVVDKGRLCFVNVM